MAVCSYTYEYTIPCVESGDTFAGVEFTLTVNGSAKDLTGSTIVLTLANGAGSLTTVDSGGLTITTPAAGKFTIDEQIINFNPKNHPYEIVFTFSDDTVKTYISGTWEIKR